MEDSSSSNYSSSSSFYDSMSTSNGVVLKMEEPDFGKWLISEEKKWMQFGMRKDQESGIKLNISDISSIMNVNESSR